MNIKILAALLLLASAHAAALETDGLYYDDAGCVWREKPKVKRITTAASGVPAKPKRRSAAKPKAPEDEFIGCEAVLPPVTPLTVLPLPLVSFPVVSLEELEPALTALVLPPPTFTLSPPETFEVACDCGVGVVPWPVTVIGGPVLVVQPPVSPIPEPSVWLLLLAGGLALTYKSRYIKSHA